MQTAGNQAAAAAPAAPAPPLRCDGLRKAFGDTVAVRALDLALRGGELMVLLGPAGAGKTTLLRLLAGSLAPDQGRVLLGDAPVAEPRPIALVPAPASLTAGTVAAAVLPGAGWRFWRNRAEQERRRHALDRLGIAALADRPVATLAAAERLRVALAGAMASAPQVLLLDEPFAGLDTAARQEVLPALRALQRELGCAMLVATADAEAALALADRIAVLADGELRQLGAPRALYDSPASPLVASLLGPCNLLPGTMVAREGQHGRLRLESGQELEAQVADAGPPGSRACFMIRPERVAMANATVEELGEGAVAAVLQDAVFQGGHMRLLLRLGQPGAEPGPSLVAHRPASAPLPPVGEAVALAWQPAHARLYRAA